nr:reverse transcriptase domain-containing protein [Tanacetum cinerariifolium]
MNTASTLAGPLPSNTIANPKGKLKAITTQSGLVLDGPFVPTPPPFINPEEDESVKETLTDLELGEFTIKVPPPLVQKAKPPSQRNYMKMLKPLLSNKEKLLELANTPLNENCSAVILKKLHEKLREPGKFFVPCGFSELKCKALAILGSINMINIYDDSCEDYLEDLFATNHLSGNLTFSSHSDLTSPKVKNDIFDPEGDNVLIEKLLNLDSTKDLPPPHNINPLSGSTTSSSSHKHFLEEFADELALIIFPLENDDLPFDIESDLREIEYLLNHDHTKEMDSILKDSVNECNLADPKANLFDTIPEMFTDEHTLDYSSPPLYDDYDDIFEIESDNEYVYDDPFDSKENKVKESKLLIDELDLPRSSDFLPSPEYDLFLFKDFSEVDALPSTDNEDKDFDPPLYGLPFHKEVPRISWILKTRARDFVFRSLDLYMLSFILGIQYPNLIN